MKTIYKLPIMPGSFTLLLPEDAEILTVLTQRGQPVLYTLLDTEKEKITRTFCVFSTGDDIQEEGFSLFYIGTFQVEGGLVFHLFEAKVRKMTREN